MNDILIAMLITTVTQCTLLPIYFNDVLSQRVTDTKTVGASHMDGNAVREEPHVACPVM